MKSIREIYKIGKGPSSSHTMGPERAAKLFRSEHPEADAFRVILYGSLSKTGIGHGTDRVLRETLAPLPAEIVFSEEQLPNAHPNTLDFIAAFPAGRTMTGRKCMWSIPLRKLLISASGVISTPSATMWS